MFLIGIFVGAVIGVCIFQIFNRKRRAGYLRIMQSDPEEDPYLFLELQKDMSTILSKSYVVLQVKFDSLISHE